MTTTTTRRRVIPNDVPPEFRPSNQNISPPKMAAPPKDEKTAPPKVPASDRPGKIAVWMTRQYRRIGGTLAMVDPQCGNAIVLSAEAAGLAWERLAREHPKIRQLIMKLMQTTAIGDLFMAHLPILIAVAVHHVPAARKLVEKLSIGFMSEFLDVNSDDVDTEAAA